MGKKAIVVCSVAILGIVSTATGFAAEFTRVKASQVKIVSYSECSHPRSPALVLGLIAAAALVIAQTIINYATGCICCNRTSKTHNSNWPKARIFYVLSWCTYTISFILLLATSALKAQREEQSSEYHDNNYYYHYCYVVEPGVYAAGAVLAAATAIFGILCYLTLNVEAKITDLNQGTGIITGQPQFPTHTSQKHVLV